MSATAAWTVLAPLSGACIAVLWPRRAGLLAMFGSGFITLAASGALAHEVWVHGPSRYSVGGWGAPLGIELRADGLAAVMLVSLALASLAIATYATASLADWRTHQLVDGGSAGQAMPRARAGWSAADGFWPLALLLWAALNLLFVSADAFNLYVALELTTLAAVALMVIGGERSAFSAAIRYLLAAFLGSMAYLLGVGILYAAFHALDLALIGERIAPGWPAWSAISLMMAGLAIKTALFPVHFWLPRAHSSAPAAVSALLSGLVITGSYVLVLRLWFDAFANAVTPGAAQLMGGMGAAAIVWGAVQALRQQRLKVMIAYSTVSQIGYLFLVLPLSTGVAAGALDAWSGGVYHAVSHAFAKAAMFLAAGAIAHALGHDRIVGISGIATRLPISTYAFGMAGVTLIGLPPSGGFVAKWLLLTAAITGGQWWWAAVILAGGVLTAGYVFMVLGQELSQATSDDQADFAPVPRRMEYAAMALALASLALGFRALEPLRLIRIGNPFAHWLGGP